VSAPPVGRSSLVVRNGYLLLLVLISLAPFALVIINSLKPHASIVLNPFSLPTVPYWRNFQEAWQGGDLLTGLTNSLLISGSTILVSVSFAALAAYPLARRKIRGWKIITLYFLCSVTVPIQLFLFPLYFVFASLGIIGNFIATSFVLAAVNLPLSILILRNFIASVPIELEDAALMDGAGPWTIFFLVIVPLIRPGLITVAVLVGFNAWNDYIITSTFQQGQANFTMTLDYLSMNSTILTDRGNMMAGAMLVIAPIIIFFLAIQRFFVDGITAGSVKG
jgi:raffinose/stachyose/melibiose transport system permease protein